MKDRFGNELLEDDGAIFYSGSARYYWGRIAKIEEGRLDIITWPKGLRTTTTHPEKHAIKLKSPHPALAWEEYDQLKVAHERS